MTVAIVGSYAYRANPYDVIVMMAAGILGYGMRLTGMPMGPLIVTFLVAPLAKSSLRRALLISGGDWIAALFNSSLSISLCIVAVAVMLISSRIGMLERMRNTDED